MLRIGERLGLEYRVSEPNSHVRASRFTSTGANSLYSFQNKDRRKFLVRESGFVVDLLAASGGFSSDLLPCIGQVPVKLLR